MKSVLKKVHHYIYLAIVAFLYLFAWPFFFYFSRKPSRFNAMNHARRVWAYLASTLAGIFFRFEFEEPIDWRNTFIICPNHSSNLDITAMCLLAKGNICFLGKDELKHEMVTRLFFKSTDIPVNRDSKMSSYRAFKEATERLKRGITLIIFPEGGISDDYPPTLHEFKNGPFRLAVESKVPIIPVTLINTWKIMWDNGAKLGSRPGVCKVFVHKPIETVHLAIDDADWLRDEVFNIIEQKLQKG